MTTITLQDVEIPKDTKEEIEIIKELFALLKIPVTYTGREKVDDSEKNSNEYA